MIDYTLNEVIITSNAPRQLIDKLSILAEHEWCSFDRIPKVGLLPDKHIEADLLGITLSKENAFLFISDYVHNGYIIKDLAKYYKFSFRMNHYSTFTLCQGKFEYDHILDKEKHIELNQWDYQGDVVYNKKANTFTYENNIFTYKEELMDYLFLQKVRNEKLDILLEKSDMYKDSLPSPTGRRSILQKLVYRFRVLITKYKINK